MLKLENSGLQKLSIKEMQKINGGDNGSIVQLLPRLLESISDEIKGFASLVK